MNGNNNHVITRKDNEQIMNGLKQSDVVILNTGNQCHPELVSGSQKVKEILNQVQNDNKTKGKNGNNLKPLIDLSTYQPIDLRKYSLALGGRGVGRGGKRKAAFTLAEVLITLGIIGVVAAMTIPTLMTKINHIKLKSQFKEGYAILSQAVKMANDDGWEIPQKFANNLNLITEQAENFSKYFKGATLCEQVDKKNGATHCFVNGQGGNKDDGYTTYSKNLSYIKTNYLDDVQFYLPNNMLVAIDTNYEGRGYYLVSIDINGKGAKPNALGHDVFTFALKESEKAGGYELVPSGATGAGYTLKTQYCSKTSTDPMNGMGCTYYAIQDETYFDKLP